MATPLIPAEVCLEVSLESHQENQRSPFPTRNHYWQQHLWLERMVLNLRKVISNWPGIVKVNNENDTGDKEYNLVGTDEQLGAMWLGNKEYPVEVHYVGKLPDGRFASQLIMSIWDDYYKICWKFAYQNSTYSQHVDGSRAFVLVLDDPANDKIKLTTYTPEDATFDSTGKSEVFTSQVSEKIAGPA